MEAALSVSQLVVVHIGDSPRLVARSGVNLVAMHISARIGVKVRRLAY